MKNILIPGDWHPKYKNLPEIQISLNQTTVLWGRSGVGKTSLLNKIYDIISTGKYALSIIFHLDNLLPWKNVRENVCISDLLRGVPSTDNDIDYALKQAQLDPSMSHKKISKLSQGMRQRVLIARIFYENNDFVLLDEVFNHIDQKTLGKIYKEFQRFKRKKTIVLITHDRNEAELLGDQIIDLTKFVGR